jgi:adenine-specific DNA-methyltransferase
LEKYMADHTFRDTLIATQLGLPYETNMITLPLHDKKGAIYTKSWVVELILDVAGYIPEANLVDLFTIGPAAGNGAFLVPLVKRLVTSCIRQNRSISDIATSLLAYELDEDSTTTARAAITKSLTEQGIDLENAARLADKWIHTGNYLLDAPVLPPADFVIGNPPYIRLEDMNDTTEKFYRAIYQTMRGRSDIYVAFFEAALHKLKPNGVCAFICADRWMFNQYGSELRKLISRGFSVEVVLEMHNADAFVREVNAYPAITVIRHTTQGPAVIGSLEASGKVIKARDIVAYLEATRLGNFHLSIPSNLKATRVETWFDGTDPWPCVTAPKLALLRQLEEQFGPLESAETGTKVGIGVATGLDEIFITTNFEIVESSRLLPLAMAADTVKGKLLWSGHYLIDPWTPDDLVNLEEFPRLKEYLTIHEERVKKRHIAKKNPRRWYRTIDRVNHKLVNKHKLYIPDIQNRINPVLDNGQTYPHHNLYFVQSEYWDLEVLGGILISDVAQFFIECYCVRMRGGYFRFQAQYLRRIHVPAPQDISAFQKASLIEAFRNHDVTQATRIALDIYHIRELPIGGTYQ